MEKNAPLAPPYLKNWCRFTKIGKIHLNVLIYFAVYLVYLVHKSAVRKLNWYFGLFIFFPLISVKI